MKLSLLYSGFYSCMGLDSGHQNKDQSCDLSLTDVSVSFPSDTLHVRLCTSKVQCIILGDVSLISSEWPTGSTLSRRSKISHSVVHLCPVPPSLPSMCQRVVVVLWSKIPLDRWRRRCRKVSVCNLGLYLETIPLVVLWTIVQLMLFREVKIFSVGLSVLIDGTLHGLLGVYQGDRPP